MPHRRSTLQCPDKQFIAIANSINELSAIHASEWHLDPEQITMLQTLTTNANIAYVANNDLATKNHTTAVAKQFAFGELKRFLGIYISALVGNIHVSDEALAVMKLRPRSHKARRPISAPTVQPVVSITSLHDELTVYVAQPHIHPTASVAPEDYHAFALRWKFEGDTEYKTVISTHMHHTLFFDQKDETRRVILSAAFVNPRLQPGPWSNDITEVLG
jgi:hypothetical protein